MAHFQGQCRGALERKRLMTAAKAPVLAFVLAVKAHKLATELAAPPERGKLGGPASRPRKGDRQPAIPLLVEAAVRAVLRQ
jgi:hypothetical protein